MKTDGDVLFSTGNHKRADSKHRRLCAPLLLITRLRCPHARPVHNKILYSSRPGSASIENERQKTRHHYQGFFFFFKPGQRHSIKWHIIKTHFERKITSSILPQIVRAIFQRPSIMEIMKRQFHPWVELGQPSALLALCFIMSGCKH